MFNFKALLGNRSSAADLADAITEIEAARDDAAKRVRDLEAERPALLLQAPDAQVRKNESDIADARLNHDRAVVAIDELRRRLATAQEREGEAAIDAQLAAARNDADRGVDLLGKYETLAGELVSLLHEMRGIRTRVREANMVRGDRPKVRGPDAVYAEQTGRGRFGEPDMNVQLPSLDGANLLWPVGRR